MRHCALMCQTVERMATKMYPYALFCSAIYTFGPSPIRSAIEISKQVNKMQIFIERAGFRRTYDKDECRSKIHETSL